MDLLSRLRIPRPRPAGLAALAAFACAASCAVLGLARNGPARFAFSHAIHVEREGLDCANCHEDLAVSDAPGMPHPDTCDACHAELDADKAPERTVASLFDGDRFRAARAAALGDEPIFSHLRHVQAGLDCNACHRGVESNEVVGPELGVGMASCTSCHEARGVAGTCATCHREIDAGWKPENHAHEWKRLHGRCARASSDRPDESCQLCHEESTCARCHLVEPPANHTAAWRLRAHGFAARMDRQNCAACHMPDSCDRCHAETEPQSHVGPWGDGLSTHCLGCHFPLASNGCVTCHKATPGHLQAVPKPAWHTPAMNCTQCHKPGQGEPLPHVDKGDNCNLCHL